METLTNHRLNVLVTLIWGKAEKQKIEEKKLKKRKKKGRAVTVNETYKLSSTKVSILLFCLKQFVSWLLLWVTYGSCFTIENFVVSSWIDNSDCALVSLLPNLKTFVRSFDFLVFKNLYLSFSYMNDILLSQLYRRIRG